MKKTKLVCLGSVMFAAIMGCSSQPEFVKGDINGKVRDTTIKNYTGNHHYRYYGGGWYPIMYNGMIAPHSYSPSSTSDISRPGFNARPINNAGHSGGSGHSSVRTGGFGSSSHFSSAS